MIGAALLFMTVCSTTSGDCVEDFARRFDKPAECDIMKARYRHQYELFIARPAKMTVAEARCKPAGGSKLGLGREAPSTPMTTMLSPRSVQFAAGMLLNSQMPSSTFFPNGSTDGILGTWYETTSTPPFASAYVLAHAEAAARVTMMEATLENIVDGRALHLHLSDLHNDWIDIAMDNPPWAADGRWHQIAFIWDTGAVISKTTPPYYAITVRYDGNIELIRSGDVLISSIPPIPFIQPYQSASYWSVGGDLSFSGGINYHIGQMAELFGIFRPNLYTDATAPIRFHSGLAEIIPATGDLAPTELGIACTGVVGAVPGLSLPALCMRGPMPYFAHNQYDLNPLSLFSQYSGTVVTGNNDPWQRVH